MLGSLFLLLCGLFDAFDGRVARRKKDRTELERQFGIQIDSLTDLVAFGVLPACIGIALMRYSPVIASLRAASSIWPRIGLIGLLYAVLVLYILAALVDVYGAKYAGNIETYGHEEKPASRSLTGL